MKKPLTLLKGNIDKHIIKQVKENYHVDSPEIDFDCEFEFRRGARIYTINVPYEIINGCYIRKNKDIRVYDNEGNEYSIKKENLIIDSRIYNPKHETVQQVIDKLIEIQLKEIEESKKDSMESTYYTLNEKMR